MIQSLWAFIREKIPFAMTGLVATGINYGMYLFLVDRILPPGPATVIAYSSSVVLNFFLQRYFVFELRRSLRSAFVLSMGVSVVGLFLDWMIVVGLHKFPLVGDQEWIIKLVATGIVFFYNFYAKRRVFEGPKRSVVNAGRRRAGAGSSPMTGTSPEVLDEHLLHPPDGDTPQKTQP
jgi:putative flippase GtrA